MAFEVVAQNPPDYQNWLKAQKLRAQTPSDPIAKKGFEVFREATCMGCHTIRGSFEVSELGPDLTHLMSRNWIAARTLPNTQGHLSGWVANPDGSKPGALMPGIKLPADEYNALMFYLRTLK
jgi:cytochrome c oxidase subunit 2